MPGVLQVTFYSKESQGSCRSQEPESLPSCWSLPAVVLPNSPGEHRHPMVLNKRVAAALGIEEGDSVVFTLRASNTAGPGSWYSDTANTWAKNTQDADFLFALPVSIADTGASFDAAIETNSERTHHIFDGMVHNPLGNFVVLANGTMLKLNEQERIYRAFKTSKDLRCSGMMVHVDGLTDYYNHNHGAGCGFSIYASTPLASPKPSEQMVQGYRYLRSTNTPQEAVHFGLLEALVWVLRLDFQTVWIVGSAQSALREVLNGHHRGGGPLVKQIRCLLDRARQLRIQLKFLTSNETGDAMGLATRAIIQRRNETWCHWSTINYQSQRNLPFSKSLARQVSI